MNGLGGDFGGECPSLVGPAGRGGTEAEVAAVVARVHEGVFVPRDEQDRSLWDEQQILEGAGMGRPGAPGRPARRRNAARVEW